MYFEELGGEESSIRERRRPAVSSEILFSWTAVHAAVPPWLHMRGPVLPV